VVILLDDTGGNADVEAIRTAAGHLIERIGQRPIVLGTLSGPSLLTAFEDDRSTLLERLKELQAGPATMPVMTHAALSASVEKLREAEAVFASIIVIASRPEETDPGGSAPPLAPILQSGAIVHSIIRNPRPLPPVDAGAEQPTQLLRELTDQTGGQYLTIYSTGSYRIAVDRIADRLAGETVLEYMVPEGTTPGGAVRVGVRIPGARVRGLGLSRARN
jgi:hypothetical protein